MLLICLESIFFVKSKFIVGKLFRDVVLVVHVFDSPFELFYFMFFLLTKEFNFYLFSY